MDLGLVGGLNGLAGKANALWSGIKGIKIDWVSRPVNSVSLFLYIL